MTESTSTKAPSLPQEFVEAVQESLTLLEPRICNSQLATARNEALPSLLDQCLDLLQRSQGVHDLIQVRTVHHFACTGGTLISKCLSALPNVQLLSEVDPHSTMSSFHSLFAPSDLVKLARHSSRGIDISLISEIFIAGLEKLVNDSRKRGLRLILRDHAHSQFCHNELKPDYIGLRDLIKQHFQTASIITVRHPIDSYLSLINNNWKHFTPFTLDEYSRRYIAFLDQHADCELFYYEDFVDEPESTLKKMCDELKITYEPNFKQTFFSFVVSGDSGRQSNKIKKRPRRNLPPSLIEESCKSKYFPTLCDRMGYSYVIN